MRNIYLIGTFLGLLIPYFFLFSFLFQNSFDIHSVFTLTLQNYISIFWSVDVIISGIILIIFILSDGKNLGKKKYFPIIGTLAVGVSFGLPLYLYLKEAEK